MQEQLYLLGVCQREASDQLATYSERMDDLLVQEVSAYLHGLGCILASDWHLHAHAHLLEEYYSFWLKLQKIERNPCQCRKLHAL